MDVVVVVVIVFNHTSPNFHKPVFSDYRQLYAFKGNNKYIFIAFPRLLSDFNLGYPSTQSDQSSEHQNATLRMKKITSYTDSITGR